MTLFLVICLCACSSSGTAEVTDTQLTMPDLTGVSLSAAVQQLEKLGFTDIKTELSDPDAEESRFVIVSQNYNAGDKVDPDETVKLVCMQQFDLSLAATSDDNWLFSKYDMDICLDDQPVGIIKNGESLNQSVKVLEGEHTLSVNKHNDPDLSDTYILNLKADTDLSFDVSHDRSGPAIKNVQFEEKAETAARTVPVPAPTPTPTPEIIASPEPEIEETPVPTLDPKEAGLSEETQEPEITEVPEETQTPEVTELPEKEQPQEEIPEETPEPVVIEKINSTLYEDAEEFKNGRVGSYVFKVPDTWVKGDKRFDLTDEKNGPYFTYEQGVEENVKAASIYNILKKYQEQFAFEEVLGTKTYFFDGNKTSCVSGIEKVNDKDSVIHTIYMFADELFEKPVIFNFYEPYDSEVEYSGDFMSLMNSISDYTYKVKDVLTKGHEIKYETDELEYSNKTVDPVTLVSTDKEGVVFSTSDTIDLTKLGEQTVTYTVARGLISATETHTFTVKDTKKPKIKIESKEITLKYSTEYDPLSNIVSVKDPVDGALEYVESDPGEAGNGWYYLEGPSDISKAGHYDFTVHACDKHGKKTTKAFSVVRKAKKKKKSSAPKYDYVLSANTGKFHYPNCRHVKQIKKSNRVYFHETREYMIKQGYDPCKHCNP